MADVAHSISILEQIRLVSGLRWRILRNSLRKKNNRLDLIGMIFAAAFSSILVISLCFAFYVGAYEFLSKGHAGWIAALFWGIFLFWQLFPILVAGFGATFEFRTLLRFPLSLTTFYFVGLAYGLADFSAIASVCWLLAMTVGATAAKPGVLPAMLLIGIVFVLLNVTLERLIGSWMEKLLSRRRTREIFLGLFVLSMISLNFINPLVQRYGGAAQPMFFRLLPYFAWSPPSLAGRAIAAVAQLQPAQFLLGSSCLLLYVIVLSAFLWRRFAAQYRGEELSETAAPAPAAGRRPHNRKEGCGRRSSKPAFSSGGRRRSKGVPLPNPQRLRIYYVAHAPADRARIQLAICRKAPHRFRQSSLRGNVLPGHARLPHPDSHGARLQ